MAGVRPIDRVLRDIPAFAMDPDRVGQVLTNFLTNALEFTPRGGTVAGLSRLEGRSLRCEVADTARGIASDEANRPEGGATFWCTLPMG